MYVVIIGANNISEQLIDWYSKYNHEITIIEKSLNKCHEFDQLYGPICQRGDATDLNIQKLSGMERADILIVATKNDSTNFVISTLAKSNFKVNTIINRINNMNYSKAFEENGFDILINVESSILKSIEQETSILAPWPIAKLQTNPLKEIIGIKINDDSNIIGKSITEIELPSHCQLLLIIRSNGITDIPSGHKTIHPNDELIVLIHEGKKESMLEDLKKLALEAIRIKTRIKADTEKLQEIKNQVVEKSKDRNSSYTIKVDDGSIRIIKYKRLIYFKLNQRGFDKLDNETKNNLLKNKLVKIKFSVNYDGYEEASNKNSVPNNLKELVDKKERKPFSVSVLLSKKEEDSLNKIEENIIPDEDMDADDEALEDLYLNVFPQDMEGFTDDDTADLTDIQKQELGATDEERYEKITGVKKNDD